MKTATLTTRDAKSEKVWAGLVEKNQDDYGWGVIETAEKLGANLDNGLDCKTAESLAVKDSGITGFMTGMMAKIIWSLHPRGEEFKRYWNSKYGGDPNAKGTINPAIVTISKKG